jgi:2,4-dienoyl-CoA reductase-like NADH-dependent reductase (Old Yellow Enzyme family)
MSNMSDPLFERLRINQLEIAGRIFKTATTETLATEDGFISDEYLRFYEPYAWAGTPLIITGNMYVGRSGKPTYRSPGIDDDDKIPGLRRVTDMVHRGTDQSCWAAVQSQSGRQRYRLGTLSNT